MKIQDRRSAAYESIGKLYRNLEWYQGVFIFAVFMLGVAIGCLVTE